MLSLFLISLGVALLAVSVWDQTWTILGEGGGPLTRRIARLTWRTFHWVHGLYSHSRVLSIGGVWAVISTVAVWVLLPWVGWSLVLIGGDGGVVRAGESDDASVVETIYFAGYTLSTLGIGDVQPRGATTRLMTAAASFGGLVQVSFAVGYLIPVIVAATDKRRVAIYVSCLGESSHDVILNMWEDQSLDPLGECLRQLTRELALIEQRYLAYPVLLYLHSFQRAGAIGPSLAVLDDLVSIVTLGVPDNRQGTLAVRSGDLHAHRRALSTLMETLDASSSLQADVPPVPSLAPLRAAGFPTVDDATFARRMHDLADRRRCLHRVVCQDGWSWDDVATSDTRRDDEQLTTLYDTTAL